MVSEREIKAAIKAIEAVPIMDDTYSLSGEDAKAVARAALSAAARVRAEANNECGEAAHPAPQPSVKVKPLEWVASDDWEYRWTADLYAIEDQGKNWSKDRYWLYYNGQRLGKFGTLDTALFTAQADYDRRILSALTAGKPEQHPDDEAVDRFAAAMKAKMKWEREERGRYGWNDPEVCSEEYLAKLLIEHLAKGNEGNFEDVANICMMLHQRGAHPRVMADALMVGNPEQSGWQPIEIAPKDGTKVDLWVVNLLGEGKRIPDCSWGWGQWIGSKGLAAERLGHKATHWMPLPTPPTAGGSDEG